MALLDGFPLDADITVSELRKEDVLAERLHIHHGLRLRRRNDVLGVVIEAEAWRAHTAYVHDLEAQIERHEDQAVRDLIARRTQDAQFVNATPEVINEIDRQYRELTDG
ncbi:MAG TPA: hypothetical protein VII82_07825 [Polyangiaceae bacterium]